MTLTGVVRLISLRLHVVVRKKLETSAASTSIFSVIKILDVEFYSR